MQGKKYYQEKLFAQFQLSERIPKDNFYRRLKGVLGLDFLYVLTKGFYGSSGENYAMLEAIGLKSFIPPHGTYKGGPENFVYNAAGDHYVCPRGKVIPFTKVLNDYRTGSRKKECRASKKVCIGCPIGEQCLDKSAQEKKFSVTYYRGEYERNNKRVNGPQGRYMKGKQQSTVEPVFGTLTQFMGLRKINTLGLGQANKCMHLSVIAYNLKKYLKFIEKRSIPIAIGSGAGSLCLLRMAEKALDKLFLALLGHQKFKLQRLA